MTYVAIITLLVAMAVSWGVTPLVIRLGQRLGAVDLPGGRKIHRAPTPRIGGLSVLAGFVAGLGVAAYLTGSLFSIPRVDVYWRGFVVASIVLLAVGLADDLWGVSFRWKFLAQLLAAVYVWFGGFRIDLLSSPAGGAIDLGLWSLPVTVLWVVAITNAVNLIDGLDGLAAGSALITTIAVAVLAHARLELGVAAASLALAGSLLGFLRFNFSPARIFLGDSGSLFLGFVLATTSVRGSQKGATLVAVLVPLLVLALPLLDTGMAVLRRLARLAHRGRRTNGGLRYVLRNLNHVFLPDREHIHHRLLDLGLSPRRAVLLLYGVGGLFACAAFALVLLKSRLIGLLLVAVLAAAMTIFLGALYLSLWRLERAAQSSPPESEEHAGLRLPVPRSEPRRATE